MAGTLASLERCGWEGDPGPGGNGWWRGGGVVREEGECGRDRKLENRSSFENSQSFVQRREEKRRGG